jgi:hypothetical protein
MGSANSLLLNAYCKLSNKRKTVVNQQLTARHAATPVKVPLQSRDIWKVRWKNARFFLPVDFIPEHGFSVLCA